MNYIIEQLFQSYLRHGVTTNTSNFSLRHSVSFNIKFLESKHD